MVKVFQKFDLNLEEMMKLSGEERKELNLPEATKTLTKELLEKGYTVFGSNKSHCGVPENILVGGDLKMDHKNDFYTLAEKLGLKFMSGEFYGPLIRKRAWYSRIKQIFLRGSRKYACLPQ